MSRLVINAAVAHHVLMDDLTDEQIEELHEQLSTLVADLEHELAAAKSGTKPVDLDEPIGRLSRMDALQQQQMNQAHKRRASIRLDQARAALRRVNADEYGYCLLCDEPIGYKRLSARPESPTCLVCQSERER